MRRNPYPLVGDELSNTNADSTPGNPAALAATDRVRRMWKPTPRIDAASFKPPKP
jgi:hypothetical protein